MFKVTQIIHCIPSKMVTDTKFLKWDYIEVPKIASNLLFGVSCAIKMLCVFHLLFKIWYGTNLDELEGIVFILLQWVGVCWHLGRTAKPTFGKMQINWMFLSETRLVPKNPRTDALQLHASWKRLFLLFQRWSSVCILPRLPHKSDLSSGPYLTDQWDYCIVTEKININSCQDPQVLHEWILYSLCSFSAHILSVCIYSPYVTNWKWLFILGFISGGENLFLQIYLFANVSYFFFKWRW